MKHTKLIAAALALSLTATMAFAGGKKEEGSKKYKIGIAKIVQHVALDSVEQGIIDVLTENGIEAVYDLQNANGDVNTAAQIAAKYRDDKVDVAVGIATPVAIALANTLHTTPVVFGTVTDPVGAGLVTTVEHGDNNVTGMSDAIPTEDHIALFKEIAGIKTLGYIYSSNEANSLSALELVESGCKKAGINLVTQAITNSSEVKQAAETIVNRVDGIYLSTDNTVFSALAALVDVFGQAGKPVFSADVTGAMDGGCMIAFGFNYYKAGRATGEMVLEILKGADPATMPVRFMTDASDSDFLIDLDAAKKCGITIPEKYLAQANMIIENGVLTNK